MKVERDPGSFRDPEGGVFHAHGRVLRVLSRKGATHLDALVASGLLNNLVRQGLLIAWNPVPLEDVPEVREAMASACAVVEHPPVPFLSYCYEWPFSMLKEAALCTLEVAKQALEYGFILKDATPYNVQFLGPRALFIDLLSLEPYREGEPWRAYHQFCRLFLNPLLLQASTGVPFQSWLRGNLEGISPEDLGRILPWRWKVRPVTFVHVLLQAWLEHHFGPDTASDKTPSSPRVGKSQVLRLLRGLYRAVEGLRTKWATSPWARYQEECHYPAEAQQAKEAFVARALQSLRPKVVWDLGCNLGHYTLIASRYASLVIGMDSDDKVIDSLYQRAKVSHPNVLPLVIDLMDPSPDRGWAQEERQGLIRRGPADVVLCLALVHHLALRGNLPFGHLVRWLAQIGQAVLIEFVPKDDPRAQLLLRWREDVYPWYTQEAFEKALEERFQIRERYPLPHTGRILYTAVRRHQ